MTQEIDHARPRYPVATLAQMSEIPAEAIPRFVAELPAILQTIADAREAAPEIAARTSWPRWLNWLPNSVKEKIVLSSFNRTSRMTWIDDDKQLVRMSLKMSADGPAIFDETRKMSGGQ